MGLKGKLKSALGSVWSPITVWMADEGSDTLVTAGQPAKVIVAGAAGIRDRPSPSLIGWLASLESTPGR
jgi:hypothetical protein